MKQLDFIFAGGRSKRFHTQDTIDTQNIAEHSFGVAWLCYILTESMPTTTLLMAALAHDLAEHKVGDIPSPVKRLSSEMKNLIDKLEEDELEKVGLTFNLTVPEKRVLKLADLFDGLLYCKREHSKGNKYIAEAFRNFRDYLIQMDLKDGIELQVYRHIMNTGSLPS